MRTIRNYLLDAGTGTAFVCALAMTGMALRAHVLDAPGTGEARREISDWRKYSQNGHRLGPADAAVTIVEWGDYQCPACRRWASVLDSIRADYPEQVAVVYRHWPLNQHAGAYPAARAAECAAAQGRFEPFHHLLYKETTWGWNPQVAFGDLAARSEVPDLSMFAACIASPSPSESVERDIAAVLELGGMGTPTLLVNNVHYTTSPEPGELKRLINELLERRDR